MSVLDHNRALHNCKMETYIVRLASKHPGSSPGQAFEQPELKEVFNVLREIIGVFLNG
jgi:hypothetical protein